MLIRQKSRRLEESAFSAITQEPGRTHQFLESLRLAHGDYQSVPTALVLQTLNPGNLTGYLDACGFLEPNHLARFLFRVSEDVALGNLDFYRVSLNGLLQRGWPSDSARQFIDARHCLFFFGD